MTLKTTPTPPRRRMHSSNRSMWNSLALVHAPADPWCDVEQKLGPPVAVQA